MNFLHYSDFRAEFPVLYPSKASFDKNTGAYLHRHDFYEIFIVDSGKINHTFNQSNSILSRGQGALIFPGNDTHMLCSNDGRRASVINMAIPCELFENVCKMLDIYFEACMFSGGELMLQIFRITLSRILRNPESTKKCLCDLLLNFYIECGGDTGRLTVPNWLESAINAMNLHENYFEGYTAFIRLSGKSREYVTRQTKKHYGQSPTELINRIRTDAMATMLVSGEDSVTDIIYNCGFNNISYANRLFRARFHKSPRDFRSSGKIVYGQKTS